MPVRLPQTYPLGRALIGTAFVTLALALAGCAGSVRQSVPIQAPSATATAVPLRVVSAHAATPVLPNPQAAQSVSAPSPHDPAVPAPTAGADVGMAAAGGELSAADADAQARRPLARGLASWYGPRFHGRRTASGERFDKHALTAAHRTLPFGTSVRVRSVHTGKEVVVRINDRGPFQPGRIIDLSRAAMLALGTLERGVTEVELLHE